MQYILGHRRKLAIRYVFFLKKKADKLDISPEELAIWGVQRGIEYKCDITKKETNNKTDFFTCKIEETSEATFQKLKVIFNSLHSLEQTLWCHINVLKMQFSHL